jgi:hypothetical protein
LIWSKLSATMATIALRAHEKIENSSDQAVAEPGLTPGLDGHVNATAENEAASGTGVPHGRAACRDALTTQFDPVARTDPRT